MERMMRMRNMLLRGLLALRYRQRTGWQLIESALSQSIGDHSFGGTILTCFISIGEGVDPNRPMAMATLHELDEVIPPDFDPLTKLMAVRAGVDLKAIQDEAVTFLLSTEEDVRVRKFFERLYKELKNKRTRASRIVSDACLLERLLCARYMQQRGEQTTGFFVQPPLFFTKTAHTMWEDMRREEDLSWWDKLFAISKEQ